MDRVAVNRGECEIDRVGFLIIESFFRSFPFHYFFSLLICY